MPRVRFIRRRIAKWNRARCPSRPSAANSATLLAMRVLVAALHVFCAASLGGSGGTHPTSLEPPARSPQHMHSYTLTMNCPGKHCGHLASPLLWGSALCARTTSRDSLVLYADACASRKTVGICNYNGLNGVTLQVPANLISYYNQASHAQQTAEPYSG